MADPEPEPHPPRHLIITIEDDDSVSPDWTGLNHLEALGALLLAQRIVEARYVDVEEDLGEPG